VLGGLAVAPRCCEAEFLRRLSGQDCDGVFELCSLHGGIPVLYTGSVQLGLRLRHAAKVVSRSRDHSICLLENLDPQFESVVVPALFRQIRP
jgi:hypothetical protein